MESPGESLSMDEPRQRVTGHPASPLLDDYGAVMCALVKVKLAVLGAIAYEHGGMRDIPNRDDAHSSSCSPKSKRRNNAERRTSRRDTSVRSTIVWSINSCAASTASTRAMMCGSLIVPRRRQSVTLARISLR